MKAAVALTLLGVCEFERASAFLRGGALRPRVELRRAAGRASSTELAASFSNFVNVDSSAATVGAESVRGGLEGLSGKQLLRDFDFTGPVASSFDDSLFLSVAPVKQGDTTRVVKTGWFGKEPTYPASTVPQAVAVKPKAPAPTAAPAPAPTAAPAAPAVDKAAEQKAAAEKAAAEKAAADKAAAEKAAADKAAADKAAADKAAEKAAADKAATDKAAADKAAADQAAAQKAVAEEKAAAEKKAAEEKAAAEKKAAEESKSKETVSKPKKEKKKWEYKK
uniref:Uncharacterized protein n=1 Tax=Chromera velia CCMP2878 TaxID=1169474 RepID=A0A0G4FDV7_9ALVE|mmetsp:Transcript_33087/g.65640  ORF Transcript_33087/g.65640 Transcript_33087/m.65640 type:complete len:279 (-) Transcript_33087:1256-2092(-)|eukprot:Cvel_16526.t1-p1 / transcript=Cvel_16526.t1 / gene=Cvel_16526 / organism=Chromera_velia_CCMP2878 / gene_product=hypothetical protein / transcript_product=hypothetical protein / location=Cvel_scaffold1276:13024-15290(+) / protein_length=278 / sequence_SO=supercontig / SO=protein_coding / is_pseudo=false